MSPSLEELKATLSGLPVPARAELAHFLLHSLEPADERVAEEWVALSADRMAEVQDDSVTGIPADHVWQSVK